MLTRNPDNATDLRDAGAVLVSGDLGDFEHLSAASNEVDAVAFLIKAEATDQIEALRGRAIEAGDGFLLRAVASETGVPTKSEEWKALAEAATRAGKDRYAAEALRQAERGES